MGYGGLDLNSQADPFPDLDYYQNVLQPDGLGLPPNRSGSRSGGGAARPPHQPRERKTRRKRRARQRKGSGDSSPRALHPATGRGRGFGRGSYAGMGERGGGGGRGSSPSFGASVHDEVNEEDEEAIDYNGQRMKLAAKM
uniref:Uncharacterized protein n=1 Tax=Leersia perrieri TaxID=77586 RepID=A0A0D9VXV6_9ORYZ